MNNLFFVAPIAAAFTLSAQAAAPVTFKVTVVGNGPDIILIPGLASSAAVWDETRDHLKLKFRLHIIQVAGFAGLPQQTKSDAGFVAPFVSELATYIKDRKLKQPAIIGHSLGGEAALMIAARNPGHVGKVFVVDALPFYSLLFDPKMTVEKARPFATQFRDNVIQKSKEDFAKGQDQVIANLVKNEAAKPAIINWSIASDRSAVAAAAFDLMTTDLRPEIAKITVPVTVIYAYDPIMGIPTSPFDTFWKSAYANVPNIKLHRIDASFHFIMYDQPEKFRAALDIFLTEKK
jgi:pimeloyl-ACP methyl ester carboxylesterase